jgi:hypothetical protein
MKFTPRGDKKQASQAKGWFPAGQKDWRCDCPKCPTYKGTGEDGNNFCAIGQTSTMIAEKKGCICKTCPIAVKAGAKDDYCCMTLTRTHQMFDNLMGALTK